MSVLAGSLEPSRTTASPPYGAIVILADAVPLFEIFTASVYVPARTRICVPGVAAFAAAEIVLKGRSSVPAFESLPLVAT